MTTVKFPDGVELTYDETIKVGDLVTTCWKGFFRVVGITPRKAYKYDGTGRLVETDQDGTPVMTVEREYNNLGLVARSKEKGVDASCCLKATDEIPILIKKLEERQKSLQKILDAEK
jgi:hypothetical protein